MNKLLLLDEELMQVTGGTFIPNTYAASGYNQLGITIKMHVFSKDEFYYMGHPISYDQANEIMRIGNRVLNSLNSEYDHKNNIQTSEPAFQRAFNYQLSLQLGKNWMWDGKPGVNLGWL